MKTRWAVACGLATILIGAASPPSLLRTSLPADGAVVTVNPHWVRLYFTTDVIVHSVEVKDSEGRRIPLRWGGPEEPSASLEALLPDHVADGSYDLYWKASNANGVNEDTSPTQYKRPSGPQDGHVRFSIRKDEGRASGR